MLKMALLAFAATLGVALILMLPLIYRARASDPHNLSDSSHRYYGRNHH